MGEWKLSYKELAKQSLGCKKSLMEIVDEKLIGLWIDRHVDIYAGVLGIVASGKLMFL